jgi:hypothetical protein
MTTITLTTALVWKPGDPCGVCGSRNTGWNAVEGGHCNGCGACDSDEQL